MGYIFDALNKQNSDEPEDGALTATASDGHAPEEPTQDSETGLADLLNSTAQDDSQDDTPFRLSDVQLSDVSPTTGADPAVAIRQTEDEDNLSASLDSEVPLQIMDPTPTTKAGWWQRLLGGHLRGTVDDRLVAKTSPASAMSEEYRSIRTSILARHDNERHLVHTITSATPQEGKTITCVNLGLTFAELRNRKTIIIECDLRLPTFGKLLNCGTDRPGLIDYLRGDVKLADIIQKIEGSALHIITAGGRVSDEAVQLLSSQRMSQLIRGLRAKYDHVIIDTPPVLQLADAGILGSQSEEVLVVARMRRTPRPLVEQAINTLTSYNAQVNGIVATDNPRSRGRGYGYKYGYRYGYGYAYGYGYTSDSSGKKRKKRRAA